MDDEVADVMNTMRRRLQRCEDFATASPEESARATLPVATDEPTSINHARFAAMAARLAQVAAKAAADSILQPASAHDRMDMTDVLRFLTDIRRIAEAISEMAVDGSCLPGKRAS